MTPVVSNNCHSTLIIIDEIELTIVRSLISTDEFSEFLDMYTVQIKRHLTVLRAPSASSRLASSVHHMIGSARAIGARKVEAIARQLEGACEADDASLILDLTTSLISAWTEVMEELARITQP